MAGAGSCGGWGGGGVRDEDGLFPHGIMYGGMLFESLIVNQKKNSIQEAIKPRASLIDSLAKKALAGNS